jgi:SLT domain-containing protein
VTFNDLVNVLLEQSKPLSNFDIDTLAALLVKEAGGEPDYISGMAGVMNAITSRAGNNPDQFISVALKPKQFSAFNNVKNQQDLINVITQAKKHPRFNAAREMVASASKGTLPNIVGGASHYHVTSGTGAVKPKWSAPQYGGKNSAATPTTTLGHHTFFTGVK